MPAWGEQLDLPPRPYDGQQRPLEDSEASCRGCHGPRMSTRAPAAAIEAAGFATLPLQDN